VVAPLVVGLAVRTVVVVRHTTGFSPGG